jgi:NAD(P)H-dependent flavin oxidoreductase YrpB (nitropropane dioxygenase family)
LEGKNKLFGEETKKTITQHQEKINMNKITQLFNIQYPIIQAGMIWCSGWQLASAVSNAGGLGIIGSGSMYPEVLREHIIKLVQHILFHRATLSESV